MTFKDFVPDILLLFSLNSALKVLCVFNVIAATLSTVAKEERLLVLMPIIVWREQIRAKSSIWGMNPLLNYKLVVRSSLQNLAYLHYVSKLMHAVLFSTLYRR